ncbi:protein Smg [mine drainage metagenome]|uniref:Protein Smg n=1 Tax=mine drainage metagenome TaxID=410659 RepID=A0A1J5RA26_9ZZZZ
MFEVLVYLFENYFEANIRPDQSTLARELSAAGFDQDDIERAFDWFGAMENMSRETEIHPAHEPDGFRIYADEENNKISADGRSFLMFLEQAGVMKPSLRELVIDRAVALPDYPVTLEKIKWIVLMSLWNQNKANDYLFIADAIFGAEQPTLH